jgi:hypothetical protein
MMAFVPVKVAGRDLEPHKGVVSPILGARTVLTNSPWTFVALWLQRRKQQNALFYWNQAHEFYKTSVGLPTRSAPLLLYYCYMNAAKALLSANNIPLEERHGITAHPAIQPGQRRTFNFEGVRIHQHGIVPSLSEYYGETETAHTHPLRQMLFNMVFIHRTYALTFTSQQEMYLPLTQCEYKIERKTKRIYLTATVSEKVPLKPALKRLPRSFVADLALGPRGIRSKSFVQLRRAGSPKASDLNNLLVLNRELRASDLRYIAGSETLWYVRLNIASGPGKIDRQNATLVLAAMHRLSEICRYRPLELEALLSGQKNWLLSEFIEQSPNQFIDEIATEMTGHQFLIPNIRKPS